MRRHGSGIKGVIFLAGAGCGVAGTLIWKAVDADVLTTGPAESDGGIGSGAAAATKRGVDSDGLSGGSGGQDGRSAPMSPAPGAGTSDRAGAVAVAADEDGAEGAGEEGSGLAEILMQMGASAADGKVRSRIASLKEKLDLTEPQEREIAEILGKAQQRQAEAIAAFLQRRATLEMLPLMDGHDSEGEAAIAALLDDSQQAAYAAHQVEQEAARIEMKANRELMDVQQLLNLSPEQKDLAFDLFTELARSESPAQIDATLTLDQFTGHLDESLGVRREAMREILTPDQAGIYNEQLENFRGLVLGSIVE